MWGAKSKHRWGLCGQLWRSCSIPAGLSVFPSPREGGRPVLHSTKPLIIFFLCPGSCSSLKSSAYRIGVCSTREREIDKRSQKKSSLTTL